MKSTNNQIILAIDPGTRYMGFAVLEKGELIHYGVKSLKNRRTPHENLKEARQVVLRLIRDFRPGVLAVEKVFFANNRNSALLNVLIDEIRAIGKRKQLKVVAYAPSTIKKRTTGNGRATKEEVAQVVVSRYSELRIYLAQNRKWKQRYHGNMFDAVALAVVASIHSIS